MYEMTGGKLLPRLANESSHNCQNPEDSALQRQRKTKTSTTVAPRGRGEPSSCNTRPHTGKHSHATAAPECTAVGVGRVLPERQLSGAASCSFLRLKKESNGNFKVNPCGGIDLSLFFCRARTHYKVSEFLVLCCAFEALLWSGS